MTKGVSEADSLKAVLKANKALLKTQDNPVVQERLKKKIETIKDRIQLHKNAKSRR
jgi:hypothetical protein